MIGFALCGSFCSFESSIRVLEKLSQTYDDILPIMSYNAYSTSTKFGNNEDFNKRITDICGKDIVHDIITAEPIGPSVKLDCLCVCPCTGNTLAKIAHGICDTPVTMAVKAQLRNARPVVLAIATNDALSGNAANIGSLLQRRNIYFVPFSQDDPDKKPRSAVCDFSKVTDTISLAMQEKQLQRLI